jgi:hypothetical protein
MLSFKQFLKEAKQPESFKNYIDRLESLGVKRLGQGINSYVFQHPTLSRVAVKVFLDDDIAYREYLEFCIKHPNNKFVPKILDTEDFARVRRSSYVTHDIDATWDDPRGDDPAYSIAFIERLSPVTPGAFEKFLQYLGSVSGKELRSVSNLGLEGWQTIANSDADHDLVQFAKFLVSQLKRGRKLDMGNRKNFMARGHEVLFVDPFF